MSEIKEILANLVVDHPLEESIYGDYIDDPVFEASIKEEGILQPLIVCQVKLYYPDLADTCFVCISGHRRLKAAIKAGFKMVPAIIRHYDSQAEADLHFTICNSQRVKTEGQLIKEFLHTKQIICQIGKLRMSKGTYADTILENEEVLRIVKGLDIKPGKPLDTSKIIDKLLGISNYKQAVYTLLYSPEKREKAIEGLRSIGLTPDGEEQIYKGWMAVVQAYEKEEISLKEAQDSINQMIAEARFQLTPKPKKEKREKPEQKPVKSFKFDFDSVFSKTNIDELSVQHLASHKDTSVGIIYEGDVSEKVSGIYVSNTYGCYRLDLEQLSEILSKVS